MNIFFLLFEVISISFIQIPLFKNANSLILLSKIEELKLIDEKTSFEGKKFILVPFFLVLPICLVVLQYCRS